MSYLPLVAGGVKMIGTFQKGSADAGAAEYNAGIADQNAAITTQQGEAAAQMQGRAAARAQGSAIAAYGASGVQTDSGSALDVLADSAAQATLDNLTTKYNYALKSQSYSNQAALDRSSAGNARTAAVLGMSEAALNGVSKLKEKLIPDFGSSSGSLWSNGGNTDGYDPGPIAWTTARRY